MRGDGGKFGQLGLANREPREGSAPSPRPRLPRSGSASVWAPLSVRGDQVRAPALRLAVRELQPPPPAAAAAFASSAAAEPGAGELARPR